MITTVNTKKEQLEKGYFKTGSGNELILILGSCRAVPYVGYFDKWNNENGNRFTICFIDPFNWNWNEQDERIDYEAKLLELEKYEDLLVMIRSCTIFIHEFYSNHGMFNLDKNSPKNIYQFGMHPTVDICLPNFNDIFILTADIVRFDNEIRKMAIADYNVTGKLSKQTLECINKVREKNLDKFYRICEKSSYPQFGKHFKRDYKYCRFFWTHNHIAKQFTIDLFSNIVDSLYMYQKPSSDCWSDISSRDMFANNYTYLTEYDEGYEWKEEIKPLKDYLL